MISNALLADVAAHLKDEITHIGVGEAAAPDVGDTLLASELVRKASTNLLDGHEVLAEIYLDDTEQNGKHITNVGAYGDTNTKLFAGGSIDVQKVAGESLTVAVEILVERE